MKREIKFRAWITTDVDDKDNDIKSIISNEIVVDDNDVNVDDDDDKEDNNDDHDHDVNQVTVRSSMKWVRSQQH